jgi:hypothetical protein
VLPSNKEEIKMACTMSPLVIIDIHDIKNILIDFLDNFDK